MTIKTIAAVALTALALPLAASAQSAGHEQLARSLGVEPGAYSVTQLAQIASFASEDSSTARQQIARILGQTDANDGISFGSRSVDVGAPKDFGTSKPHSLND